MKKDYLWNHDRSSYLITKNGSNGPLFVEKVISEVEQLLTHWQWSETGNAHIFEDYREVLRVIRDHIPDKDAFVLRIEAPFLGLESNVVGDVDNFTLYPYRDMGWNDYNAKRNQVAWDTKDSERANEQFPLSRDDFEALYEEPLHRQSFSLKIRNGTQPLITKE